MRIIVFIGLVLITLFTPLWLSAVCVFLYAFRFQGYETLFLAVCVDAQFGAHTTPQVYWYTLIFALMLISVELVRPYINVRF